MQPLQMHRRKELTALFITAATSSAPLSSHEPVHALRFVSISQVPQGYERGGCGVPTLYEKQKEHGSVPASRSAGNSLKLFAHRRAG